MKKLFVLAAIPVIALAGCGSSSSPTSNAKASFCNAARALNYDFHNHGSLQNIAANVIILKYAGIQLAGPYSVLGQMMVVDTEEHVTTAYEGDIADVLTHC